MRKLLSLVLLLGLMAACGGHDHDDKPAVPVTPAPPTTGTTPPDAFAALVEKVVATAPDDTEAAALDDAAPTMPEGLEPNPVAP